MNPAEYSYESTNACSGSKLKLIEATHSLGPILIGLILSISIDGIIIQQMFYYFVHYTRLDFVLMTSLVQ